MKKNKKWLVPVICTAVVLSVVLVVLFNGKHASRPFDTLTADEVKSISLYSVTGEIIYTFNESETKEIVEYLNGIEIGAEDNREYVGGFNTQFRLEKNDGTIIEFGTNAIFWLDGQRYEVPDDNASLRKLRKMHNEYYREYYVPLNAQK